MSKTFQLFITEIPDELFVFVRNVCTILLYYYSGRNGFKDFPVKNQRECPKDSPLSVLF